MANQNSLGSRIQIRSLAIFKHIEDTLNKFANRDNGGKKNNFFNFPTLLSRLIFVYATLLGVMFLLLYFIFSSSFQTYFIRYTENIMINQAKSIAKEYYNTAGAATSKEDTINMILTKVKTMDSYLNSTTWIIDSGGNGYIITKEDAAELEAYVPYNINVNRVLNGEVLGVEDIFDTTNRQNDDRIYNASALTIGFPITVNGKTQYALFIHTPIPYVLQTTNEMRNFIVQALVIVGIVIFIWLYAMSKQITNPLLQMSLVARRMSKGRFDERVPISGTDEISQLGSSLNYMAEELLKMEEQKNLLLANISHDLRSPLTSIKGFVNAILDGTIEKNKQDKYLNIVLEETERLIKMANAILELNKIENRVKEINFTTVDINYIIDRTIVSMENRIAEKNVCMIKSIDKVNKFVQGEPDNLGRVVQNLLDNALKFVANSGKIEVMTETQDEYLWIRIKNDGPIIPEDKQRLIWERFYKCDTSRGEDKKGIGLGLVIVKEIVKQHGGEIGVVSKENYGTEFYFSLKLA